MRHVHKGFTLVELLIVIAIIGTLSAMMSVSTSGATAKAKAAAIAANVDACKSAAVLYAINATDDVSEKTADDVLKESIPTWIDFSDGNTKYAAVTGDDGKGSDKWAITVDFSGEPEKVAIRDALRKIKGYKNYNNNGTGMPSCQKIHTSLR